MNDAQLSLSFDDDERLLHGRAYMRPTLWNDIEAKMRPESFAVSRLSSELSQLQRLLAYDMRLKRHYLRQSVEEPATAVVDYYVREVSRKWQQFSYYFDRMYQANEFYMRNIHQALQRHYDDFRCMIMIIYFRIILKYTCIILDNSLTGGLHILLALISFFFFFF